MVGKTSGIYIHISPLASSWTPGVFYCTHVPITTPVVSALALKNYYTHFRIQVAVSEVKRPLRSRSGSETVTNL
jgi:hypothetical protein